MHKKSMIRAGVLAVALACSSYALAAPQSSTANSGSSKTTAQTGGKTIFDQLDLTEAQRTSVKQLMKQNFEQARPEMQALGQKRMAFENATPGSSNYQSIANDLAQAESNAAHAQVLRQANLRTKIYDLLTPTQRTKLASIRAQNQEKMREWRAAHMRKPAASASH